jgi:hypothetical protein
MRGEYVEGRDVAGKGRCNQAAPAEFSTYAVMRLWVRTLVVVGYVRIARIRAGDRDSNRFSQSPTHGVFVRSIRQLLPDLVWIDDRDFILVKLCSVVETPVN